MSGQLHVTVTVERLRHETADDCDHATLMGVVRRALEDSDEFRRMYGGQLVGLVAEMTMSDAPYRSAFRASPPGVVVIEQRPS